MLFQLKCGQEGHWASGMCLYVLMFITRIKTCFSACPNPQGGSDSNKRFKSGGTSGGGDNVCFKCGEPGHYSNGMFSTILLSFDSL